MSSGFAFSAPVLRTVTEDEKRVVISVSIIRMSDNAVTGPFASRTCHLQGGRFGHRPVSFKDQH